MAVAYFKELSKYLHVENGEKHKKSIRIASTLVKIKPPGSQMQVKHIWF
jgi:hypothetical protein